MNLKKLTILKYLKMIDEKKISSVELIDLMHNEAQKVKHLNIFVDEWFDEAKEIAKNNQYAIPIGIKDLFLVKGKKITAGSRMLKDFNAPYTGTVINRLLNNNAVFVGSCNMDEFAMGGSGKTSYYGPTISPWKNNKGEDMCPGGSSSGSAAALASGLCLASTGTDTGGSIRLPAAYSGLVGLKPTYGVFSRYGVIDFASNLDCPGLFTRDIADCEFLFNQIIGEDDMDYTSVEYTPQKSHKTAGVFIPDGSSDEIKSEIEHSIKILEKHGYKIKNVKIDYLEYSIPCYYVLAPCEAASNLSRYNGIFYGDHSIKTENLDDLYTKIRSECFGDEVQRRIVIGNFMMFSGNSEGFYNQARKIINKIWRGLRPQLEDCDFVIMPVSHGSAPTMAQTLDPDPIRLYMEDFYTCFANMIGLPALSLPTALSKKDGMPLGIQIVSKPFGENLIFDGAKIIENKVCFIEKCIKN